MLELAAARTCRWCPGSAQPLLRPVADARDVHGESGLGAASLPPGPDRPASGHAVDFIIEQIGAAPGEITLVATGPLTNIALAVRREPRLAGWVRDFVIMGGSAGRGNTTPAAEFNIWADPEAAAITFRAGWQVTMVGLDVTLQARATPAVQDRLRPLGRLAADLLLPGLLGYQGEASTGDPATSGPAVHDVLALALVAEPGLFGCQPARVEVETAGRVDGRDDRDRLRRRTGPRATPWWPCPSTCPRSGTWCSMPTEGSPRPGSNASPTRRGPPQAGARQGGVRRAAASGGFGGSSPRLAQRSARSGERGVRGVVPPASTAFGAQRRAGGPGGSSPRINSLRG